MWQAVRGDVVEGNGRVDDLVEQPWVVRDRLGDVRLDAEGPQRQLEKSPPPLGGAFDVVIVHVPAELPGEDVQPEVAEVPEPVVGGVLAARAGGLADHVVAGVGEFQLRPSGMCPLDRCSRM